MKDYYNHVPLITGAGPINWFTVGDPKQKGGLGWKFIVFFFVEVCVELQEKPPKHGKIVCPKVLFSLWIPRASRNEEVFDGKPHIIVLFVQIEWYYSSLSEKILEGVVPVW